MIGVIPRPEQLPVVEEFFELFKTPWELYRPGRHYDVVVATVADVPEVEAGLLIVYGAEQATIDARHGIAGAARQRKASVSCEGADLPIYGEMLTFAESRTATRCIESSAGIAGLRVRNAHSTIVRVGYDLFREVQFLLTTGQPLEQAHVPALDLHIRMLRNWILDAGVQLLEIAPAPAGYDSLVCLTHDIDFVGIRRHLLDHTMWGFLYRSTVGTVRHVPKRRLSITRMMQAWRAAASLPFVYLGWARDFWEPFAWYLNVEKGLPATYYLIPFKGRPGARVTAPGASRRATAYDITDLDQWTTVLTENGCELGVHGIDAWHDENKGRDELGRVSTVTGGDSIGIRMHWLLQDANTPVVLERAGYAYDSTAGYNETIGYRNGTTQVFRPLGATTLLELPLHIQDGALFYPRPKLGLTEPEAERRCQTLIDHARRAGGVLTVLWHDRSHGPERFWGDFYVRLVRTLRSTNAWFGTAGQTVSWFRKRREVRFDRIEDARGSHVHLRYDGTVIQPPLRIIVHRPSGRESATDIPWNGGRAVEFESVHRPSQSVGSSI